LLAFYIIPPFYLRNYLLTDLQYNIRLLKKNDKPQFKNNPTEILNYLYALRAVIVLYVLLVVDRLID